MSIWGGGGSDTAKRAAATAGQWAGIFGGEAESAFSSVSPVASRWLTTPPGYSPEALATMQTREQEIVGATGAASEEQARLRAMRTGNIAGVGAADPAIAQAASRAHGAAIQGILSANERLKEQQRMVGLKALEGLYGPAIRGSVGMGEVQARDIASLVRGEAGGFEQTFLRDLGAGLAGAATGGLSGILGGLSAGTGSEGPSGDISYGG